MILFLVILHHALEYKITDMAQRYNIFFDMTKFFASFFTILRKMYFFCLSQKKVVSLQTILF